MDISASLRLSASRRKDDGVVPSIISGIRIPKHEHPLGGVRRIWGVKRTCLIRIRTGSPAGHLRWVLKRRLYNGFWNPSQKPPRAYFREDEGRQSSIVRWRRKYRLILSWGSERIISQGGIVSDFCRLHRRSGTGSNQDEHHRQAYTFDHGFSPIASEPILARNLKLSFIIITIFRAIVNSCGSACHNTIEMSPC